MDNNDLANAYKNFGCNSKYHKKTTQKEQLHLLTSTKHWTDECHVIPTLDYLK